MKLKYIYWNNDGDRSMTGHLLLEHILSEANDVLMCGKKIPELKEHPEMTKRIKRIPAYDICKECLDEFKQSDHPEAVEYRRMFALWGGGLDGSS